jgi:protein deglycase
MKRVLILLFPGFEELEAVAPLDLLRRAGIEVVSASVGEKTLVTGSHGIQISADKRLEDCLSMTFDMVILPGGPGVDGLRQDKRILDLVERTYASGTLLAAICAAPLLLADAGIALNHTITSFPSVKDDLAGRIREYSEARVVVDGKMITSRGAGTAEEFALKLIEILISPEVAEDIRTRIVARLPSLSL